MSETLRRLNMVPCIPLRSNGPETHSVISWARVMDAPDTPGFGVSRGEMVRDSYPSNSRMPT
jgi:hypothetical protein